MSVSLEALAMAGANYLESGMDIEEWEQQDLGPPPPHLLAEEEEREEEEKIYQKKNNEDDGRIGDDLVTILYHVKESLIRMITNERTARRVWSIGRTYMRAIIRVLVMIRIDIINRCKASSPPY